MEAKIDQKAYLQKYLKGPSDKKKKRKKNFKGKGLQIIDEDIDISKLRPLEGDELDVYGEGEDAPQVVGIIDERPDEIKKLEQFKTTTKWKVINQDDGFNSKLQIEEIKKDIKEVRKENEIVFGKMYSDSEDEQKNDSDLSPPRINNRNENTKSKNSSKKHNSDSDFSPPRRKSSKPDKNDSDTSPPRKRQKDENKNHKKSTRSPSPRKDKERSRKPSRWGHFEPEAEYNQTDQRSSKRKENDSDISPPRKSMRSQSLDSDLSPQRKSSKISTNSKLANDSKRSKKSQSRNHSDSDESPPRKRQQGYYTKKRNTDKITNRGSDSDLSPPRKNKRDHSPQTSRNNRDSYHKKHTHTERSRYNESPPPSNKKMARTLEGKVAGLQDAKQLRQENEAFKWKEDEAFRMLGDEVSGRNAKAVSRKSKRETSEERLKQKEKAERQKELDEKYKKWSKGLKQIEDQEARHQDFLHEASKPLARHKGDADLEDRLKQIDREGDPMLKYIREKKRERGELGPERPMYKGNFPPNRFNLRPGHRWDGVDRSNGYEKKYFQQQSNRRAQEMEAYKWSTEDL